MEYRYPVLSASQPYFPAPVITTLIALPRGGHRSEERCGLRHGADILDHLRLGIWIEPALVNFKAAQGDHSPPFPLKKARTPIAGLLAG